MIRVVFLDIDNTLLSFSDYVRETMLIGDSLTSDIAGGKNYGMQTCWYRRQAQPVPVGSEPDFIVDHLTEVRKIL